MTAVTLNLIGLMTLSTAPPPSAQPAAEFVACAETDTVVTVHGLGRTRLSMQWIGRQFERTGYRVVNVSYRSTRQTIEESAEHLRRQIEQHPARPGGRLHFVTHSLGGIVVRACLQKHRPANLGRVVMLGPPNRGSELADHLASLPPYRWATGPAGQQLGTGHSSVPNSLGPVDYDVGVIAGDLSFNPIFSAWIPGKNDGKVSIERAGVDGMSDLLVVRHSHSFMMRSRQVAGQALHFIAHGRFRHDPQ